MRNPYARLSTAQKLAGIALAVFLFARGIVHTAMSYQSLTLLALALLWTALIIGEVRWPGLAVAAVVTVALYNLVYYAVVRRGRGQNPEAKKWD